MKATNVLLTVLAAAVTLGMGAEAWGGTTITGAGATFPYPVYSKWAYLYNQETGVRLNYQSIGSGGGIKQIKAKTVDFGASDAPMKAEDLEAAGLIQWPMIMGGVVPVVHLDGIGANELVLTPDLLASIYLGKITRWDDAAIRKVNPDLVLPKKDITVVHRADGSGTTWIFTNYLTKVSGAWKEQVGNGKAVSWPVGLGGKGNEGVAGFLKKVPSSIGYVEYAYALQNKLSSVKLLNRAGKAVAPTAESFQSAAANADWDHTAGFAVVLTDQPGEASWPITGASFILMHRNQPRPDEARAVLDFLDWCFIHGDRTAMELDYVPIPDKVVDLIRAVWSKDLHDSSGRSILP